MSEEIKQIKEKITPILKEYGVLRASIFGSYARGEAKEQSDVDILIEAPSNTNIFDLVDIRDRLQINLGKKVDIGTYKSIKQNLRDTILNEQVLIYGK